MSGADRYAVAVAGHMRRRYGLDVVMVPDPFGPGCIVTRTDGVPFTERERRTLANFTAGWRLVRGGPR